MTERPSSPLSRLARGTVVTFPEGATSGTSRALASGPWGLLVEETPFHPLNTRWPEQPADQGTVEIAGRSVAVVNCLVGAVEYGSDRLAIGSDIPVPHGATGWHWLVVHVLDEDPQIPVGAEVSLTVDARHRLDVSVAHTARHLSGLALNATLASLWCDGVPRDSLGSPNFDALALSSSAITPAGFRDIYRTRTWSPQDGELSGDQLHSLVKGLGLAVTARIQHWLFTPAPIRVVAGGPYLTDARSWKCDLPQGTARVACGGTHPTDLGAIADVQVAATLSRSRTELILDGTVTGRLAATRARTRHSGTAHCVHTGSRAYRF